MGQQQLLLLVLGVIIVGVSIAIMITLFKENAVEQKRDILIDECTNLAEMAIAYYRKPKNFGGGGKSFSGWEIPNGMNVSENGYFLAEVNSDQIIITGTGNEVISEQDTLKIEMTVLPTSYSVEIIH